MLNSPVGSSPDEAYASDAKRGRSFSSTIVGGLLSRVSRYVYGLVTF